MIKFNKSKNLFIIETINSHYLIQVYKGIVSHVYYGSKITPDDDVLYLTRASEIPYGAEAIEREKLSFEDMFPKELPTDGLGDFRETSLSVSNENGNNAVEREKIHMHDEDGTPHDPYYAYDPRCVKVDDTYYILWRIF